MLIRSGFLCIVCLVLCQKILAQQYHELGVRFGPSLVGNSNSSGVSLSSDSISNADYRSGLEFDLCYTHVKNKGKILRARIGHWGWQRNQTLSSGPSTITISKEKQARVFLGVGFGHSFSAKFITIRMGLECMFAWQYQHASIYTDDYLNRLGMEELLIVTTTHPREITSGLQVFGSLYLNLSKRVSGGVEFRQPLNLIFIRGNMVTTRLTYDGSGNILVTENQVQQLHETRLETDFIFSPLLGICVKL